MAASSSRDLSVRTKAYHLIQRKILSGELTPGAVVSELALAKELSSSRTPIREAIGQLVSEGVLEQTPGRGTVVAQFSSTDILELYELREVLECHAVAKVSRQKIDASDIARLQGLVDEIELLRTNLEKSGRPALNTEEMQRFVSADLSYHTLLLRLAGNRRILKVVQDTRLLMRIFSLRREGHDLVLLGKIHRYHSDILNAVVNGDGATAQNLLREHIRLSCSERIESFKDWERELSLSKTLPTFLFDPTF